MKTSENERGERQERKGGGGGGGEGRETVASEVAVRRKQKSQREWNSYQWMSCISQAHWIMEGRREKGRGGGGGGRPGVVPLPGTINKRCWAIKSGISNLPTIGDSSTSSSD